MVQQFPYIIMGMGQTGSACARFLQRQQIAFHIMDSRSQPPNLAALQAAIPNLNYSVGGFDAALLAAAATVIISPGLPNDLPALAAAKAKQVPIISEIELFARFANAPVVAITGSNGKSTVTTLLGEMAQQAGWRVPVGGNLGTPALDLLSDTVVDSYFLELSSFQLEATFSLNARAATVLNLSADHMDRYPDMAAYAAAKQRIFRGDGTLVLNADDPAVAAMAIAGRQQLTFSVSDPQADLHIRRHAGEAYFCHADQLLAPVSALRLQNTVMYANALAALALGTAIALPVPAMGAALAAFRGLPHRCEWVATYRGVEWINDSKGTNVGATLAAIQGMSKRIVLIAGGDGKGADFSPLAGIVGQLRAAILIGQDAEKIAAVLKDETQVVYATCLETAVQQAASLAQADDVVLLSPACASLDMFKNYLERGQVFVEAVKRLAE